MFCPECISSMALAATGIVSTGGASALVLRFPRVKAFFSKFSLFSKFKEKPS